MSMDDIKSPFYFLRIGSDLMAENIIDDVANVSLKNLSFENLSYFWNLLKPYIAEQVSPSGTTIDSEMSDTSENAVQNKAIKSYVDNSIANIQSEIGDIESVLSSVVEVE